SPTSKPVEPLIRLRRQHHNGSTLVRVFRAQVKTRPALIFCDVTLNDPTHHYSGDGTIPCFARSTATVRHVKFFCAKAEKLPILNLSEGQYPNRKNEIYS